jgi:hypothetical protein
MLIFKAAFSMDEACPHMQGSLVQTATRAIRFPVAAALPHMRRNPASLNFLSSPEVGPHFPVSCHSVSSNPNVAPLLFFLSAISYCSFATYE